MKKQQKIIIQLSAILLWLSSISFIGFEPRLPHCYSSDFLLVGQVDIVLNIGSRLELFIDNYLIDTLTGKAELRLHHPERKETVMVHDVTWEGSGSGYHSIFKDGDLQDVL